MRLLIALTAFLLVVSVGANAADDKHVASRTKLATEIHQKVDVRERLFKAMDVLTQFMTPTEKASFWTKMKVAMPAEKVNAVSIKAMADTYTEDELKAMLAFYSSPAGKSAESKRSEYEKRVGPEFTKLLDQAVISTGVFAQPPMQSLNPKAAQ
ncbi:MAG: DUF2059 domain-containing protein [Pseudomonadota bacterium]